MSPRIRETPRPASIGSYPVLATPSVMSWIFTTVLLGHRYSHQDDTHPSNLMPLSTYSLLTCFADSSSVPCTTSAHIAIEAVHATCPIQARSRWTLVNFWKGQQKAVHFVAECFLIHIVDTAKDNHSFQCDNVSVITKTNQFLCDYQDRQKGKFLVFLRNFFTSSIPDL